MQGTLMGIEHAMFAIAGIIGPLLGTKAFQMGGISGLGFICAAFFFVVLSIWLAFAPASPKQEDKEKT